MIQDLARTARYSSAFVELTKTRFVSLETCLDALLNTGLRTLGLTRSSVWLFEGEGAQIFCLRARQSEGEQDLTGTRIQRDQCPNYFQALHSELVIDAHDATNDPRTGELDAAYLRPYRVRALLDAPVRIFGRQVGVLCSEAAQIRNWDQPDRNFAVALATLVSLALEHAELLRTQEQLRQSSGFDLGTGLPNAEHFSRQLSLVVAGNHGRADGWVLRFEPSQAANLRSALSESSQRELYRRIAERLRAELPDLLELAHLGEGEFLLLLGDTTIAPRQLLDHFEQLLSPPFELEGQALLLAPRCGLRRLEPGPDAAELLRDAETAVQEARASGQRLVEHSAALDARLHAAHEREQAIRHAAQRREFELLYQPMIELFEGRLTGLEALIRWRHPEQGVLGPEHFLQVLLDTGLIVPIGHALFCEALATVSRLQKALGRPDLGLSFNLSAPELASPRLVGLIRTQLAGFSFPRGQLALEVTENAVLADETGIARTLGELRDLGCRVHLDDFGTGYSSLNHIRRLPFDAIKIDRSFLLGALADPRDRKLIQMLVSLSHEFGRESVAEGIADRGLLQLALSLDAHIGQGFLIAEPLAASMINPEWLRDFETRSAELISAART